ncbi:MAG: hypothetical protein ABIJ75_11135 [Actinomycetota bacterium]
MSNLIRTIGLILVIGLLAAGCGGDDGYSEQLRTDFLGGCEPAAGTEFCECALAEIEKTFTEEEFLEMGVTFPDAEGDSPAALDSAIAPCLSLRGD